MSSAAGEAGGVIEVAGAGGLRVREVVHGSVSHLVAVRRPAGDDRCCSDPHTLSGLGLWAF